MLRMFYLGSLLTLQCALLVQAAPPLWRGLRLDTVLTAANAGHVDYSPLAVTGLAVVGVVLTLSFPTVALLRHSYRGETLFCGMPRWAIALAIAGAVMLLFGCTLQWLVPHSSIEWRLALRVTSRNATTAGTLLMTAGVLCAELLQRGAGGVKAAARNPFNEGKS
jgi:hypothetical protein